MHLFKLNYQFLKTQLSIFLKSLWIAEILWRRKNLNHCLWQRIIWNDSEHI